MLSRFERRDDPHSLASEGDCDPQNSSVICFAEIGPAFLIIDNIEPDIKRIAKNRFLGFFWAHIVFRNVSNIRIVPIKK